MIRCIMFDFGNVIGIFDTPQLYSFLKKYSRNGLEPKELFVGSAKSTHRDYDLGKISDADYFEAVKKHFQLEGTSISDFLRMTVDVLKFDTEMVEVIKLLRKRNICTVLITNMNQFHADYIRSSRPGLMKMFDCCLVSCEEGVAKPDPEAWIRPIDFMGLKPEECLFIDDSLVNIETARRLGINAWHYNVADHNFCPNGKLEDERHKLKSFLEMLWEKELLKSFS